MATFNFVCICLHVASHQVWIDGSLFLHQFQRGIKVIQGDGNCLFHSLASIICSNEERHQHVRRLLVTFCRHNTKRFQTFCHPVPIEQHINGMEQDRVWGTDLEIHAAAALWQVQIYVCTPDISSTSPSYSWIYLNQYQLPRSYSQHNVKSCHVHQAYFISNCSTHGDAIMM